MKSLNLSSTILAAVFLSIMTTANATLITFEDIPVTNISESTITESGYDFTINKKAMNTDNECGTPTCVDN